MVDNFDIPIFQKSYDLFKTLHEFQNSVSKLERHTLWKKCEERSLDILSGLLKTSHLTREKRPIQLQQVSNNLDILRVFIRLAHDVKAIDQKKYIVLQSFMDEIGRMLGGWIRKLQQ